MDPFRSAVDISQEIVAAHLYDGAVAVDATAGNGHDTLFLAERVGPSGRVFAFDVQEAAVDRTRARLSESGLSENGLPESGLSESGLANAEVIHDGHERMVDRLGADLIGRVDAVMFNLGYLPRADHDVITRPGTTIPALDQSIELLRNGGVLTVVVYSGHPGGEAEAAAVTAWAKALDRNSFEVVEWRHLNRRNHPPFVIAVKKL